MVKGNRFSFVAKPYDGRRVIAHTFVSDPLEDMTTEEQLRRYLPKIREEGWDTLCFAPQEKVVDDRRHVFLIEEKPGSALPVTDALVDKKALKNGRKKAIENIIVSSVLLFFLLFIIKEDPLRFIASNLYLIMLPLSMVFLLLSLFYSISYLARRKKPMVFRFLDFGSRTLFFLLVCMFVLLVFDSIYGADNQNKERYNNQVIYHSSVPVSLSTLRPTAGPFHTQKEQSSSVLASYLQVLDFDLSNGDHLSYSYFHSRSQALLSLAASYLSSKDNVSLTTTSDSVLLINSSLSLTDSDLETFKTLL